MIDLARMDIIRKLGGFYHFKYHGSRGVVEEFSGVISEVYDYIFIVKSDKKVRCFSFNDIIIKSLIIK